ncbi:MAG: hypothetical protein ACFFAE_15985 [Candidatus Hodarchaeota archaeon]
MNLSRISKLMLLITIVVLISNVTVISREYQDSWVLEGLEIPFTVFVITYAITFFLEKRIKHVVALATLFNVVLMLVAVLKYNWFLGVNIDQQIQYRLAEDVYSNGYFSTQYPGVGEIYSATPLTHLSFAVFSIALNIPLVFSIKFVPVLWSSMYPLLTYTIMKNLSFSKRRTLVKYALLISSLPMGTRAAYIVTGGLLGTLLIFLILCQTVILLQRKNRRHWALLIFFVFALTIAHSTSSLIIMMLLSTIWLLQKISARTRIKSYFRTPTIFLIIAVSATWLIFSAPAVLDEIKSAANYMFILNGKYQARGFIPYRFFTLVHANFFEAAKSVIVYNGGDALFLLLTTAGMIFVLKTRNQSKNNTMKFLFFLNVVSFLFLAIGVLLRIGGFYYTRLLNFARILFPIFSGIFILHITKDRRWTSVIIFSLITLFVTPQFYGCQPLIPSANTILENLTADEPIVYVVNVNSIYQISMINYASKHINGSIACDQVTTNQIMGLTRSNFSRLLTRYYPLSKLLDENITEIEYDYFLIHLPGKAGAFQEKAEIRTKSLILGVINNSTNNLVYSNGESYIFATY